MAIASLEVREGTIRKTRAIDKRQECFSVQPILTENGKLARTKSFNLFQPPVTKGFDFPARYVLIQQLVFMFTPLT